MTESESGEPGSKGGIFITLGRDLAKAAIDPPVARADEVALRVAPGHSAQPVKPPASMDFGATPLDEPTYTRLPERKEVESKQWPAPVRALAAIVLGLLGFVFPLLFIPAAFFAFSVLGEIALRNEKALEDDDPRAGITSSDANWRAYWLKDCESPAEEAFLHTMINAFGLVPVKGQLRKGDTVLLLQVLIPPYRADFMVGERLIVEVDGAAYHSSPEAKAQDAERDAYMVSRGFTVLRIPAKVVLSNPAETARRVREALANLPALLPKAPKSNPTPRARIASASAVLDDGFRNMHRWVREDEERKKREKEEATTRLHAEFEVEMAINEIWKTDGEFGVELGKRIEGRRQAQREAQKRRNDAMHASPANFRFPGESDPPLDPAIEKAFRLEEAQKLIAEWRAVRAQRGS